jgi:hypothetical protein
VYECLPVYRELLAVGRQRELRYGLLRLTVHPPILIIIKEQKRKLMRIMRKNRKKEAKEKDGMTKKSRKE